MWSKRTRSRPSPQEPTQPAFGQDSTYGVRSVSEWGGDSGVVGASPSGLSASSHSRTSSHEESLDSAVEGQSVPAIHTSPGVVRSMVSQIEAQTRSYSPSLSSPGGPLLREREPTESEEQSRPTPVTDATPNAKDPLLPSGPIHSPTPPTHPSPEETVHPLATPLPPSPALLFPATYSPGDAHYPYSSDAETDNSSLALSLSSLPDLHGGLGPSEPSSPASFTSMPSYVASVSSMSRNSSPLGSAVDIPGSSRRMRNAMGEGMGVGLASLVASRTEDALSGSGGSGDVVLPTLSLPSSSLHLSLPKWTGDRGGLRIAILTTDKTHTRALIREIEGKGERVVAVGRSEIAVVREDKLALTLLVDHTVDLVAARLRQTYASLHALLNPATPLAAEETLNSLIEGYIAQSDWIHATLILDPAVTATQKDQLNALCPCTSPVPQGATEQLSVSSPAILPPITSPLALDEPTPMPVAEGGSYFAGSRGSPTLSEVHSGQATVILSMIDAAAPTTRASIRKFHAWRPPPLDSSNSSLESTQSAASASASGEASGSGGSHSHPIPTVARASGSGEWEANLSRRIAKRKEGESSSSHVGRGRGRGRPRRRSGQSERAGLKHDLPLFPRRPSTPKGHRAPATTLGLSGLVERTFGPVREMLQTRWGKVAVMALAVAVGLGFWASSRR